MTFFSVAAAILKAGWPVRHNF